MLRRKIIVETVDNCGTAARDLRICRIEGRRAPRDNKAAVLFTTGCRNCDHRADRDQNMDAGG
jgi:hypothetical protein